MTSERPPFPTFIDSSARKDIDACQTLAYWAHIRKLVPIGQNIHLHFGGCYARGLEVFRKSFYGEELGFKDSLAKAAHALILEWGDIIPPEEGSGSQKTLDACLDALLSYFIQWPPQEDVIRPYMTEDGPSVEWSFALPIPGITHPESGEPLLYSGRFDMLAEFNKALFVLDDKTTSALGASWQKQWALASQMTGYIWAAREYGLPVQGAIIRGAAILKRDVTFAMVIEQRPQWMIDRWLLQLQRDVRRLILSWETGEYDYSIDTACSNYGGCKYLPLCTSPEPESWIKGYYEISNWDPLTKETI